MRAHLRAVILAWASCSRRVRVEATAFTDVPALCSKICQLGHFGLSEIDLPLLHHSSRIDRLRNLMKSGTVE